MTPPVGTAVELYHWHDFVFEAPSASGNLFDVVAEVDWTHEDGETVREAQAFYTGHGHAFAFRIGAEKLGRWTGVTSSAVTELDGLVLHATVTALTKPDRSGFHVFNPSEPTWWMQQKGPTGEAVRIAPRLVMWDTVDKIHRDPRRLQEHVDLWADTYGFTGAHPSNIARWWFGINEGPIDGSWRFDLLTLNSNPDPQTFVALEMLADRWLDKGGHIHLWQYADSQRAGASSDLPGGENGIVAQRLDRYVSARLGPVPGWSLGYGFDCWESISAANIGVWVNRIASRMGWFHWIGARFVDTRTGPRRLGNPHDNCEDDKVRYGGYPACAEDWNAATTAPPQYAGWEQFWPEIVQRNERTTAGDIVFGIVASAAAGELAIPDRPHFSEDRFRLGAGGVGDKAIANSAELPAVIRGYGLAGWAAIYGNIAGNEDDHSVTSAAWSNPTDVKAANDEVTAAMEGS